jgi:hypothetical protein
MTKILRLYPNMDVVWIDVSLKGLSSEMNLAVSSNLDRSLLNGETCDFQFILPIPFRVKGPFYILLHPGQSLRKDKIVAMSDIILLRAKISYHFLSLHCLLLLCKWTWTWTWTRK